MSDSILYAKIRDRMMELGIEKFHMDFVRVNETANVPPFGTRKLINANGEYYFLVSRGPLPANIQIESDSHMMSASDVASYAGVDIFRIHEFSGNIKIGFGFGGAGTIDLEFVRAIPQEEYIKA